MPGSRLVANEDGACNIDLGDGALLYPESGQKAALNQVEHALKEPFRFFNPPQDPDVLDDALKGLSETSIKTYLRDIRTRMSDFPKATSYGQFGGFLVIFGVGLGYHLEHLAERLNFKAMIVVEPHTELILHSFHAFNWKKLREDMAQNDQELFFVHGEDLYQQLITRLRSQYYPYVDGSYFFFHYETPELTSVAEALLSRPEFIAMAVGWTEDQLVMLQNNAGNFSHPRIYVQKSKVSSTRIKPAFVVGAGPSLDGSINTIKRCREDVVVISASSSLSALLANGITPDIHCALENGADLTLVIRRLADKHDLSEVTLYASTTIDPGMAASFGKVVYFFRDNLASARFFGGNMEKTVYAEPTTGNTAIYCAASLGFRDIYLFGLDFGSHTPDVHHSRYSEEFTHDNYELAKYTPFTFDKSVPGNFGGEVKSGYLLDWGRAMVNEVIRSIPDVQARNCSDGAKIPAAPAMKPKAVSIKPTPIQQQQDIDNALSELVFCEDKLINDGIVSELEKKCRDFLTSCINIIESHTFGDLRPQTEIVQLCDLIIKKLSTLEYEEPTIYFIFIGDMQTSLAASYHYASTLEPAASHEGLNAIQQALSKMFKRLLTLVNAGFSYTAKA